MCKCVLWDVGAHITGLNFLGTKLVTNTSYALALHHQLISSAKWHNFYLKMKNYVKWLLHQVPTLSPPCYFFHYLATPPTLICRCLRSRFAIIRVNLLSFSLQASLEASLTQASFLLVSSSASSCCHQSIQTMIHHCYPHRQSFSPWLQASSSRAFLSCGELEEQDLCAS